MNKKRKLLIYGGSLVLLVAMEIVLRTAWGFGKMPLYAASSEWEYMTVPEQSGKRLGNQFYFYRYGMRCQEIIAWCQKNGVKLIKDIDSGFTLDGYRDYPYQCQGTEKTGLGDGENF